MTRLATSLLALLPALALAAPFDVESIPVESRQPRILLARRPGQTATLLVRFEAGAVDDGDRPA